jgi:deoxyhypusine synthase
MPCDTVLKPRQTVKQRADEVRRAVTLVEEKIRSRLVKVVVGKQGAVAFTGLTETERDGITDACIYRRIMATGSTLARLAITQAERVAGRSVDRRVVAQGVHSHDDGASWHPKG